MNKATAQKILKIFGIINYVGAVILLLLGIGCMFINDAELLENIAKEMSIESSEVNPMIVVGIILIMGALYEAFEGWSLRIAGKKDKTTIGLVLAVLSLIGSVLGLFGGKLDATVISNLAIDALAVYCLIIIRKSAGEIKG